MAKYKLTSEGVQDKETKTFIPNNPGNRDWRKYQEWEKKAGNKPDPEFTEEELTTQKQAEIRQIENAIVDTRVRKDAAQAEDLDSFAAELQIELDKLKIELAQKEN